MKKFLSMMAASGLPFGAGMALYFMSQHGASKGAVMGAASGVLFGLVIAVIRTRHLKLADDLRPQYAAEGLLRDSAASRVAGKFKTAGWLFLTKQRLVFEPTTRNASTRLELALGDVADVKLVEGVFQKQIRVDDKQQQTHAFGVLERELWVISIARAAATAPTSARSASE